MRWKEHQLPACLLVQLKRLKICYEDEFENGFMHHQQRKSRKSIFFNASQS